MTFPNFLGPAHSLQLGVISALAGGPSSKKLAINVSPQTQTNWCWAAVSSSISHFFNAASSWSQCGVANSALHRTDCCGSGAADPSKCNQPWYLDQALAITGNLKLFVSSSLTFAQVKAEIALGAPIGSRVGWNGGGGHFQVICGWLETASGSEFIDVSDPIYLNTQILFSSFASGYQSGGTWSHSYLTKPPGASTGGAVALSQPPDATSIGA
jgi:hypothetical protein